VIWFLLGIIVGSLAALGIRRFRKGPADQVAFDAAALGISSACLVWLIAYAALIS